MRLDQKMKTYDPEKICIHFPSILCLAPRSEKYKDALLEDLAAAEERLTTAKKAAVAALATKSDMEAAHAATWIALNSTSRTPTCPISLWANNLECQ